MHDWNWHNADWHCWGMPMMWLIWIPLIIIMVWLLMKLSEKRKFNGQKDSPLDLLKKRYANGEISTEEYEERKKVLEKD